MNRRHGHYLSPTYVCWKAMRQRCAFPKHQSFHRYGGRGIKVCERWDDFVVFLADMGERPSMAHSLDRVDNNGNYEPGNVRWATRRQQSESKGDRQIFTNNVIAFQVGRGPRKVKPLWLFVRYVPGDKWGKWWACAADGRVFLIARTEAEAQAALAAAKQRSA